MKRMISIIISALFLFFAACTDNASVSYELQESTSISEEESFEESDTEDFSKEESTEEIFVYVCGQVAQPGVYSLPVGSRVYEAIEAAGGFLEEADQEALNIAQLLSDGQQITVGKIGEQLAESQKKTEENSSGKVNINSASAEELKSLSGIGDSRAEDIINYRNEEGGFSTIDDIKNVSGIGEKLFQKIKDYIEV